MNFSEAVAIATSSFVGAQVAGVLTLLGVVIGVAAVIAVVSLINGANQYVATRVFRLGADVFGVSKAFDHHQCGMTGWNFQKRQRVDSEDYIHQGAVQVVPRDWRFAGGRVEVRQRTNSLKDTKRLRIRCEPRCGSGRTAATHRCRSLKRFADWRWPWTSWTRYLGAIHAQESLVSFSEFVRCATSTRPPSEAPIPRHDLHSSLMASLVFRINALALLNSSQSSTLVMIEGCLDTPKTSAPRRKTHAWPHTDSPH